MEAFNIDDIAKLSPPVLLAMFLNVIGLMFSKTPIFDNKYIPLTLTALGAILYPFIGTPEATINHPQVKLAILGALIGAASVGLNQVLRQLKTSPTDNSNNTPK